MLAVHALLREVTARSFLPQADEQGGGGIETHTITTGSIECCFLIFVLILRAASDIGHPVLS